MNRSEQVLERNLGRATRLVRDGTQVYQAVRNALIVIGVSASVLLPLASPTPPPDTPPTTTVTLLPNVPIVLHNEIHPSTVGPVPPAQMPKIDVAVLTSPIQGAPPISRAWHRTTFSQTGDEFWALPDGEFKLRFTRGENFSRCINEEPASDSAAGSRPLCQGSFELTTDAGPGFHLNTVPGRGLEFEGVRSPTWCRLHRPPAALTPTVVCEIERASKPDVCVWLRRSEHLESKRYQEEGKEGVQWKPETVALDIRWQSLTPTKPTTDAEATEASDEECLALLPD